jgi:hypothetical protein
MDKVPIIIVGVIVIIGALFFAFVKFNTAPFGPTAPLPEGIVLFFGQDCPHCQNVEKFIADNAISQKVQFSNLEIPFNGKTSPELETNANTLVSAAQSCKLNISNGVNIPFLWDGKNCFVGEEPVINFFKDKAGIK